MERPNCELNSTYDWIRQISVSVDIYITPDGLDADSQSTAGRRRRQSDTDVPMFVTMEGTEPSNSFVLNTTTGDDRGEGKHYGVHHYYCMEMKGLTHSGT